MSMYIVWKDGLNRGLPSWFQVPTELPSPATSVVEGTLETMEVEMRAEHILISGYLNIKH